MDLPCYYTVGPRAVKFLETSDRGLVVLKMTSKTGLFEFGMEFFARCGSSDSDVDELSEEEFIQYVESVRGRALQLPGDGPIHALYGLINAMEDIAKGQGRALTAEDKATIAELRRRTYAMFLAAHPDPIPR
jgi:hypothetical protein